MAEGKFRAELRVAATVATGRDPRAEAMADEEGAEEARRRDGEALTAMAQMLAQGN